MAYSGAFQKEQARPSGQPQPERSAGSGPAGMAGKRQSFDMNALFHKIEAAGMETDDLLMALILYLMYGESGDIDLLIMLGVMLLT